MRRCAVLLALSLCATSLWAAPLTVYLLRHAERADTPQEDPGLSPAGEARAAMLAQTLAPAGIQTLISSEYARTRLTATPLAQALGLPVQRMPTDAVSAAELGRRLLAGEWGERVVVVGHSNTVPRIAEALGLPPQADIPHAVHDRIWVIQRADGAPPRWVQLRYGAPSD